MNDWTTFDEVLAQLPRANPDATRSEHVRARCHKKLWSYRRLPAKARSATMRPIETAVVGGFCAVYVSLVALIALRTHGLL